MAFHVPNQYRIRTHPILGSEDRAGNCGAFKIPVPGGLLVFVIADDGELLPEGGKWEHVSVSIVDKPQVVPNWKTMCSIKDLFWDAEDCVVQYHPPRSEYVNRHPGTLHLWRPVDQRLPRPPRGLVG